MKRCLAFSLMFCCCLHALFQHVCLPFIMNRDFHLFRHHVNHSRLNHRDEYGRTLLHWAAESNAHEIISYLLEHDAIPTIRDGRNELPLDIALRLRNHEAASILLQYSAEHRT